MDDLLRDLVKALGGWATGVGVLVSATYVVVLHYFFERLRAKRSEKREDFQRTLVGALQAGTLGDLNDLYNIYEGTVGESAPEGESELGLGKLLKQFLAELQAGNIEAVDDESEVQEWKDQLTVLLARLEETAPHEGLPEAERNAINDIDQFLADGHNDAAKRKLKELSGMIQTRTNTVESLQSTNKWSVPLAIVSSILTLVFGILSIV